MRGRFQLGCERAHLTVFGQIVDIICYIIKQVTGRMSLQRRGLEDTSVSSVIYI